MITAEHSATGINAILDKYNLSREEFWKDPEKFLDNIENKVGQDCHQERCCLYQYIVERDCLLD